MSILAILAILVAVGLVEEVVQVPARGVVLGALECSACPLLLLPLPLRLAFRFAGVLRVMRVVYDHLVCRELPLGLQTVLPFLPQTSTGSVEWHRHSLRTSALLDLASASIGLEPDLYSYCSMRP